MCSARPSGNSNDEWRIVLALLWDYLFGQTMKTDRLTIAFMVLVGLLVIAFLMGRQGEGQQASEPAGFGEQAPILESGEMMAADEASQSEIEPPPPYTTEGRLSPTVNPDNIDFLPEHPDAVLMIDQVMGSDTICQSKQSDPVAYETCTNSYEEGYMLAYEVYDKAEDVLGFYQQELDTQAYEIIMNWQTITGGEAYWASYKYLDMGNTFTIMLGAKDPQKLQSNENPTVVIAYVLKAME